jgi:iron complex transport system ATP-binding protein
MTALQARSLLKHRGRRCVIHDLSISFRGGELAAIVGPNGAGKSTLLALLAGVLRADGGEVSLEGRGLASWPRRESARRIGWFAQQGQAQGEIAAIDVVRLGRLPHQGLFGTPNAADDAAVRAAMAETECTEFALRPLATLSGGERQRVLLARLLAGEHAVMLADEPMTHLDPPHQCTLLRSLMRRARAGAAVAVVLHDLTLALAADRVLVLDAGRLRADAPAADPALHAALAATFGGSIVVTPVQDSGTERHVVLPRL